MTYLYHMVPRNLEGSVLYPLNQLKDSHPKLHAQHLRKYEGREYELESRIPSLDCGWSDVLFFAPVHPSAIRKAHEEVGIPLPFEFRHFEIDPHLLDPAYATILLFGQGDGPHHYAPYNPDALESYAEVPEATLKYYREMYAVGERPFLLAYVPHILYRGTLDISSARIIET